MKFKILVRKNRNKKKRKAKKELRNTRNEYNLFATYHEYELHPQHYLKRKKETHDEQECTHSYSFSCAFLLFI